MTELMLFLKKEVHQISKSNQTVRMTEELPTLSSVVMASVAMLLLESVIRFSSSMLQAVTAAGCFIAT